MLTALGRAALRRATVACAARTLSVSSLRATPVVMQLSSKTALPPTTWSGVLAVRTFATTRRNTKGAKKGTATKKKAAPKKKKAKAKKAAAPKKKRVISPLAKARAERRELLSKALFDEPAQLPATPWLVYVSEHTKGTKLASGQFGSHMKQLAANFKNLSTFEIQVSREDYVMCTSFSAAVADVPNSACKPLPRRTRSATTPPTRPGWRHTRPR